MTCPRPYTTDEQFEVIAGHIHDETRCAVVLVGIEGQSIFMAFDLNLEEHQRRCSRAAGPVRSRGLLHALWALPEELPTRVTGLTELDLSTLVQEGEGFVTFEGGSACRDYRPPGSVRALAHARPSLSGGVAAIAAFPPLFRRYAFATQEEHPDRCVIAMGEALGIGTAAFTLQGFTVHTEAADPRLGVPAVYRWWLAEVGYAAWIQANAH